MVLIISYLQLARLSATVVGKLRERYCIEAHGKPGHSV
jgi:hypothetical protein